MELNEYLSLPYEKKLEEFLSTLSLTNRTPEYYVNWEKVNRETKVFELELHTLNFLLGKNDIKAEAKKLFENQPKLLRAVPILIASRDKQMDVLVINEADNMEYYNLDFDKIDETRINDYVEFMDHSGLLNFMQDAVHKNLVDYVYGVETGLDSNGRKNRSGSMMEGIIERKIDKICKVTNLKYLTQASARHIKESWGIDVPVDKSERRFDAAVFDPTKNKCFVIETNYYGGGGSKLKSVAGEFKSLNKLINTAKDDVSFVWITDGLGWHTAHLPLEEAFEEIAYVFNLRMLSNDYLLNLMK